MQENKRSKMHHLRRAIHRVKDESKTYHAT